ncbi:putative PEP-CTERM system histidine kinase [Nitrosomonas sp. Nm51]|uniref:XrtA/PEP-CTERM system histidine kinase PrsK n=1 Tax=Nitrosomonas sp. Nm51 TaxID=133720 RepID=UPI0008B326B2|nr:XrtA/PEP-CTERM system histidine kinase PrsK [Nitrosomonas sp. Nm51]SER75095.1 putative PEP-CTERM system histidine kinase [Nitrosomonas sp. Nm51]
MWTNIATISYSATAVAFLFLSILLLTSWRGRLYGMMLAIACVVSALWAATTAINTVWGYSFTSLVIILEILRNASWSAFLILLIGPFQTKSDNLPQPRFRRSVIFITLVYLFFISYSIYAFQDDSLAPGIPIKNLTAIMGCMIMAIIGIILVEQFYRNTPPEKRWGIKFICLGIGTIFTYDFYLFSDALLFRYINFDIWATRGIINTITVPLIAVSAARNPKWTVGISVSRQVIFYTAASFGTAIYLLVMAGTGYYLRFSGGKWGSILQVSFLFGAVILLIGILFSGTIRSWLKVFISKHFYSYNYDYREEWLRFTRTLSEEKGELKERAIQSLAQLVESPGGGLWLRQDTGLIVPTEQWNIPHTNETVRENSSFCEFMEQKDWVIDLNEYRTNPTTYAPLVVPQWLLETPDAWFIIPLIQHGKLFGFVVLIKPRSKIKLNWEIRDLLKVAGNQATSYLAQEEASRALMVARQFESFNRMSTFVVHDLKNLIFQLSLLLSNAEKHKNNPAFQDDMIQTVNLSIGKMKRLLEKLSNSHSLDKPDKIFLNQLLQEIVESKSIFEPRPVFVAHPTGLVVSAERTRLHRVISHIVQNAIEATPKDGTVKVCLCQKNKKAVIEIQDTGHGMSEKFVQERLFKPFESTKSAGMGIGVFESKEYIQEIGGTLEVSTEEAAGTTFFITLNLLNSTAENERI